MFKKKFLHEEALIIHYLFDQMMVLTFLLCNHKIANLVMFNAKSRCTS